MSWWMCPNCGQENEGNFCIGCGAPQPQQQSAPAFSVTFETGRHYKVHKSYIWLGPIIAVLAVIVVALFNSIGGIMQGLSALEEAGASIPVLSVAGGIIGGIALLYGLTVALYALGYKNMSYVFDEREFSFYSGIITKRRVHLPYARVQSVNHRASVIQRLAGVCTVVIDSAGGASNKALRVPFLRLETAERLRVDLFVRKAAVEAGLERAVVYDSGADTASVAGRLAEAERVRQNRAAAPVAPGVASADGPGSGSAVPINPLDTAAGVVGEWRGAYGGAVAGLEPVSYEFGLSASELVLTSVSHAAPTVAALVVGFSFLISCVGISFAVDEFSRMVVAAMVPIVVVSTVVTWLIGVGGTAISFGNYRARRRGSRIEVERGLLQRDFSGIDIARVQSIEIRQSLVRRLMGYCEISLGRINAGGDEAGKQNSSSSTRGLVIHPFVKIDRVDEILDGLMPEAADRPRAHDLQGLPKPALRRALLRRCVWYNVGLYALAAVAVFVALVGTTPGGVPARTAAVLGGVLGFTAAAALVYTAARAVGAVRWARHSGYAWNRGYLMLHNDGLSTSCSVIPRQKIQSGRARSNPFQRRLALTGISALTAAGTRSTSASLLDVPESVGGAYLDWLKPRRSG